MSCKSSQNFPPCYVQSGYYYGACYNPCVDPYCKECCKSKKCFDSCSIKCNPCQPFPLFRIQNITSNVNSLAINYDPNLVGAWGLLISGTQIWVANNATNLLTTYDLSGVPLSPTVTIPTPTGITQNFSGNFIFTIASNTGPATFVIGSLDGNLYAYNPSVSANTVLSIYNGGVNSIYTGVAISRATTQLSGNNLYAANFGLGKVDFFISAATVLTLQTGVTVFVDADVINPLPTTFVPYNVVVVGNLVYVTYALKSGTDMVPGIGNGYINIFTLTGGFVRRFVTGGPLNAPWGIIPAPQCMGFPAGSLLVGNNGDGQINVFDMSGTYIGKLKDTCAGNIDIDALFGLAVSPCYPKLIYFSASPVNNTISNGLLGALVQTGC